mmetsp:Transcript_19712/g.36793  ORF Transcript_19712/g.36793 Transcript_19712/m.36793 type:complete len:210 (+) Transcript_19712:311-940(+)
MNLFCLNVVNCTSILTTKMRKDQESRHYSYHALSRRPTLTRNQDLLRLLSAVEKCGIVEILWQVFLARRKVRRLPPQSLWRRHLKFHFRSVLLRPCHAILEGKLPNFREKKKQLEFSYRRMRRMPKQRKARLKNLLEKKKTMGNLPLIRIPGKRSTDSLQRHLRPSAVATVLAAYDKEIVKYAILVLKSCGVTDPCHVLRARKTRLRDA